MEYKQSFRVLSDEMDLLRRAADYENATSPVGDVVYVIVDGVKGGISDVTVWYRFIFCFWSLGVRFGEYREAETLAASIGRQVLKARGVQNEKS